MRGECNRNRGKGTIYSKYNLYYEPIIRTPISCAVAIPKTPEIAPDAPMVLHVRFLV